MNQLKKRKCEAKNKPDILARLPRNEHEKKVKKKHKHFEVNSRKTNERQLRDFLCLAKFIFFLNCVFFFMSSTEYGLSEDLFEILALFFRFFLTGWKSPSFFGFFIIFLFYVVFFLSNEKLAWMFLRDSTPFTTPLPIRSPLLP